MQPNGLYFALTGPDYQAQPIPRIEIDEIETLPGRDGRPDPLRDHDPLRPRRPPVAVRSLITDSRHPAPEPEP